MIELVGVRGFEPPISCSRSKRFTRLSYTPYGNNRGYSGILIDRYRTIVQPPLAKNLRHLRPGMNNSIQLLKKMQYSYFPRNDKEL